MTNRLKTKNDIAWEKLFLKYDILNTINANGQFIISATQIKEFREPRLMAKFDHGINLPYIFSDNNLSILPISRGSYIISKFKTYHTFEEINENIDKVILPPHLQSINANNIISETVAINCAVASGMLKDFLCEDSLYATVAGRMSSGTFNFNIHNANSKDLSSVKVNNSQIEIDAAFEGIHSLALIEAKCNLSEDFLIRQLYYPYRAWMSRIAKKVRPIFLVYSNGIYTFYEYEFINHQVYNSISLVKQKKYSIEDLKISTTDLKRITKQIHCFEPEPNIPFPQADSFHRIINLCELLNNHDLDREQITERYAFNMRQSNYYTDAARYLGLVSKISADKKAIYTLTELGEKIMQMDYKNRQLAMCRLILQHKVFFLVFNLYNKNLGPDRSTVIQIMKDSKLYKINSNSTYERRSSTIIGWLNWIFNLVKE